MAALKKGGSGLMEVDEDNQKIRRCPTVPLPEWNDARREELMNSTVYVKGKMRYAYEFFLLQICIPNSLALNPIRSHHLNSTFRF